MKKTQKKLGNKGFSLVELIVVIAIMAVLVGVLAPTLIRNVEKSRESTDIQNLDTIRTSVVNALNTESVEKEVTGATTVAYSSITSSATGLAGALYSEMNADGALNVKMKSGNASGGTIQINIAADGKVTVYVAPASGGAARDGVAICKRTDGPAASDGTAQKKKYATDDSFSTKVTP